MTGRWFLELLRGAQLHGEGVGPVSLERKTAALLAYVALEGSAPRSQLAGLLWPETSEKGARNNLRQLLYKLKPYRDLLEAGDPLRLCPGVSVDVLELRTLAQREEHDKVARAWTENVPLLLFGLDYDDCPDLHEWLLVEREKLFELLRSSLEAEAERFEEAGDYREALAPARRLVELEPVSEVAYRRLMRLYSLQGDRAAALDVYRRCRETLERVLGVEPLPETIALARAIDQESGVMRKPRLPLPATPFVGREKELAELDRLLQTPDCRLLTLLGPGGIGKTRLALEVAAHRAEPFADGAYFVSLAPLNSEQQLISAVAGALDFSFYSQEEPQHQLLTYLSEKELLLVLDNFEHLQSGIGLVSEVLEHAPKVKLLVTSRERLQLSGEWVFQVEGLQVPAGTGKVEGASAVQLFMQSAQRAAPQFSLSEAEKPTVVGICRAVQGMPLALELAATWIWALSPREILEGIEESLSFLSTSLRDIPERHHSLRAAFDHSWKLLTAQEQEVFCKLSVFRGGFAKEAAEEVVHAPLSLLLALMSRSLLTRTAGGRFEMHELLRQFAWEKLNEHRPLCKAVQHAHGTYYLRLLHQQGEPQAAGQRDVLQEVDEEIDNVRAAWQWTASEANTMEILKSDARFQVYFELRGRCHEGVETFNQAIQNLDENDPAHHCALGCLLVDRGWLYYLLGKYDQATRSAKQGMALLRPLEEHRGLTVGLSTLGNVALEKGEYLEAKPHFAEALSLAREEDHQVRITRFLGNLALVEHELGNYTEAKQQYQEVLQQSKHANDHHAVVISLNNLGTLHLETNHFQEAQRLFEEGLELAKAMKYEAANPMFLNNLAAVALKSGDFPEARTLSQEAFALAQESGDKSLVSSSLTHSGRASVALRAYSQAQNDLKQAVKTAWEIRRLPKVLYALIGIAELRAAQGQLEQAVTLLSFVLHHPALSPENRMLVKQLLAGLQARLPPQAMSQASAKGQAMHLEEAAELVLERVVSHRYGSV